jgi:epoxyqueuosine reductase QueG
MESKNLLINLKQHFNNKGFNIFKVIESKEYDKHFNIKEKETKFILQDSKSIILIGFSGNKFWNILQKYLRANPDFAVSTEDWIDDYTEIAFKQSESCFSQNKIKFQFIYPFGNDALLLDFMKIGELAGIGVKSVLGILLNPVYGTWMSLRGAIISNIENDIYDSPLNDFDPCTSCSKPCIPACPENTVSDKGWDWKSCMKFRMNTDTCNTNCFSRRACPYGAEHQYSEEQLAYHHRFVIKSIENSDL